MMSSAGGFRCVKFRKERKMNEIEGQKDYHMIRPMKAKDTDCVLEMMQVLCIASGIYEWLRQHFSERYRSLCRRQPVSGRIYF